MSAPITMFVASAVAATSLLVPILFRGMPLWLRACIRLVGLVVLGILMERQLGSIFAPRYHATPAGEALWERLVLAFWWVLGAQCAIAISRLMIVLEERPRETQILSDLLAGVIHVLTLVAIVNLVLGIPVAGLLATSGVIAIVLGLALQSSLADVFSGIAVGIERPYKAGDIVWIEGGIEGRVLEVNWRSTHIMTFRKDLAVVPNSVMAKSRLINHSLPTPGRGLAITVRLDIRVPPDRCLAVLGAAVKSCQLIVADPPPTIARTDLLGDGATYELSFSVEGGETTVAAKTELLGQVQRHLAYAGIPLAVPGVAALPEAAPPTAEDLLRHSDLFGVLAAEDRALLAQHMMKVRVKEGQSLIQQDSEPNALYLIVAGAVEVTVTNEAGPRVVARMGAGASLGAIGLITDRPYAATATALSAVEAFCLDKATIAAAIAARPELSTNLEALAAQGMEALSRDAAAHVADRSQPPELFLTRLRSFLHRLSGTGP
jgi:small-conductance mechanosensitive channel/CRP-like cAMP-binding protein